MSQRLRPAWQSGAGWACALLLAILFGVAGVWKLTSPLDWAARLTQMKVPGALSIPATLAVGIAELFAAALLVVPRFRRWGALITGALLVVFMAYIGFNYNTLRGEECSCFPWLKRSIGPGFFAADALMLAGALAAGVWARASSGRRSAGLILGAIAVFAGVSYGMAVTRLSGIEAPATVLVDRVPYSLRQGRHFLYFFDPECSHCFQAAKQMAGYRWNGVKPLAVPTRVPQFAGQFLLDTGLKAPVTSDSEKLRELFRFTDPPYGVVLEHGRQKTAFIRFDETEPRASLIRDGYIVE